MGHSPDASLIYGFEIPEDWEPEVDLEAWEEDPEVWMAKRLGWKPTPEDKYGCKFMREIEQAQIGYDFSSFAVGVNRVWANCDCVPATMTPPDLKQTALLEKLREAFGFEEGPQWLLCAHYG